VAPLAHDRYDDHADAGPLLCARCERLRWGPARRPLGAMSRSAGADGRFATNGAVCEPLADGRFAAGMDDDQQS
jgi:hypothetical protein